MSVATGPSEHDRALRSEQRLLRFSTICAGGFAAIAIAWGLLAESGIILLDGVYALIGVLLAGLSLRAAVLVERGPTRRYPYGREALAPLIVGVQGLVLLGSLGYALLDAVAVILAGGSQTALGAALAYAVVSALFSLVVWRLLVRGRGGSELVGAEATAWLAGLLLSVGMFAGFGVALLLESTSAEGLVPYIDPLMVIVASLAIAPTPVRMLRQMYTELLEGAAPPATADALTAAVDEVSRDYGLLEPTIRTSKLGRKIYLQIDYLVVDDGTWSISDIDRVRALLLDRLTEPGRTLWLNVEFHTDPAWLND